MRRYLLTITATVLATGATLIGGRAEAAQVGALGTIRTAVDSIGLTEQVYWWRGHDLVLYVLSTAPPWRARGRPPADRAPPRPPASPAAAANATPGATGSCG
jgi:hypothetical protein